jgi:peroxiredoxin
MKTTILIVASVAAASAVVAVQNRPTMVQPGTAAPTFSLPSAAGKTVSLADHAGSWVVLEWTNKDCPYVVKHYASGNMQATQAKAKAMGAKWLTVISSAPGKQGYLEPGQATEHYKSVGASADAVLIDAEGAVGKAYGARNTPQMVVIDPKGNVVYHGAIDDDRSADPAATKTAKNLVLAALEEAKAGKPVSNAFNNPYGCGVKY